MRRVNIEKFHQWFRQQEFSSVVAVDWDKDIEGETEANIVAVIKNPGTVNEESSDIDEFLVNFNN